MKIILQQKDSSVVNFISYQRLVDQLRRAGEFKANEEVVSLVLDTQSITYHVVTK